jgi:hypothetical protein
MKKIFSLGITLFCLFSIGFSQTTISSNTTITQSWVNANGGPWIVNDGVTITFAENFTVNSATQYFILSANNITINGAGYFVTIDGVIGFIGLVTSGTGSNNLINSIGVQTLNGTTLAASAGYIGASNNKATITNCTSSGNITEQFSGGIAGDLNSGSITNCYSTGAISATFSGGIVGERNTGSITNCYTTGVISGNYSGGISGSANNGTITNCYSTGSIDGFFSGGIAGVDNKINGSISNCYTTGSISGNAGGISGKGNAGSISNCYTTGIIADGGGVIVGTSNTGSLSNNNTVTGNWTDANTYLLGTSGVGAIWNTTVTPYTLLPLKTLVLTNPSATLTTCLGVASSAVSFGVEGSGLTASVTITAPSNYEIASTINGTYASSLVLDVTSGTVSRTLFARLTASAPSGNSSGTITASSTGASNATITITGTVHSNPILSSTAITICKEGSFLITASTSAPVENGWVITGLNTVNKDGYITAGTVLGEYIVSYTNACFLTSSATITVVDASSNIVADVTGGVPSYKFDGTPKGPVANIYVGYIGFTYSSESQPTGRGFYRANQVSGTSAGCPYSFSVFKCSNCPVVPLTPVLSIGETYGGGIVAYILQDGDPGYISGEQHGLIAAASDQSISIQWYNATYTSTFATAIEIGTGFANTNAIIAAQGAPETSYAAGLARAYRGGGHSDWYLPSKVELGLLYNNIGHGAASPNTNIGGFERLGSYWSSSEYVINRVWVQKFDAFNPTAANNNNPRYVRAIRSF